MSLITTNDELKALCRRLKKAPYLAIDTEFMREKTYWPILCLIQVAWPEEAAAIDPLAEGLDLEPFLKLLADPKIDKVFHGGRQDLEIFYDLAGEVPAPVFDTQVAAMVCGFGDQVSYEKLVKALTQKSVDKASRYTNWSLRPLSKTQLDYALKDVIYLCPVYEKLKERVQKLGRDGWLQEEYSVLSSPLTYQNVPEDAWKRLKVPTHKPRVLAILREVAALRERYAQKTDVPRGRILRDEVLVEVALHPPTRVEDLRKIRGLPEGVANGDLGKQLLKAVKDGMNVAEEDCPRRPPLPDLPAGLGPTVELLKVLLRLQCEEHMVAPKLVAHTSDLELLAADDDANIPALHGWRREIYGEAALALKHGKMALTLKKRKIRVVSLED